MTGEDRPARGRAPWWRDLATLLTVIGLLVTLVFNTLAVRDGAQQDEERRQSEQIGLLTQLNGNAITTVRAISATGAPQVSCALAMENSLKPPVEADLTAAVSYYEYLAWLFNKGRLEDSNERALDSRPFFTPNMVDAWRLAKRFLGAADVADDFPELTAFARASDARDRKPADC